MNDFDVIGAVSAQSVYCSRHACPMLAPDNGWCVRCGHNIYEPYTCRRGGEVVTYGISVSEAGRRLITRCPFCNTSFTE